MGLGPWLTMGGWIDTASGVLFLALGVAVALVRPRRLLNAGFALFAAGFGVHWVCANVGNVVPGVPQGVYDYGNDVGYALWIPGAVLIAERFPRPWAPAEARARGLVWGLVAVYAVTGVASGFAQAWSGSFDYTPSLPRWFDLGVAWPLNVVAWASVWLMLLALPLRHAATRDPHRQRAIVLVSMALVAYNNLGDGMAFLGGFTGRFTDFAYLAFEIVMTLCLAGLWLRAARRARSATRRAAWWMAVASPGFYAAGALFAWATDVVNAPNLGLLGASRLFGVAILAYAIVRLQLFDIDLKLKWTLKRSTLLAVFLAVFFVVDQLIQALAGQTFGAVAGAVASGLLLFALHPLQKMTERVADAAMPHVRVGDAQYLLERKRETYRDAYATAWADGVLTPKDARMLHQVRDALGLPEKDILAIERDATPRLA